jgi:hypothetical protein
VTGRAPTGGAVALVRVRALIGGVTAPTRRAPLPDAPMRLASLLLALGVAAFPLGSIS